MARPWRCNNFEQTHNGRWYKSLVFNTLALLAMLAFLFKLCDVTAKLLHYHRSKIECLFSYIMGNFFFASIMASRRQGVWLTVDVALPSEAAMTAFNDRLS